MKAYQVVLILIVVLAVNNVLLLSLLGYFSEESAELVTQQVDEPARSSVAKPNADTQSGKPGALQLLAHSGLSSLDSDQLQTLYKDESYPAWSKSQILIALLQTGDPSGLELAKHYITDSHAFSFLNHEIIQQVYDHDAGFVVRYLNQIDLKKDANVGSLLSFAAREPDLSLAILSSRFDEMLDSENNGIYRMSVRSDGFEMTAQQQAKVVEFFQSGNRAKRMFALNFVSNIEDVAALREAFSHLSRHLDRRRFIDALFRLGKSPDKQALARELAANSEDPLLQKLAR